MLQEIKALKVQVAMAQAEGKALSPRHASTPNPPAPTSPSSPLIELSFSFPDELDGVCTPLWSPSALLAHQVSHAASHVWF